MPQMNTRSGPAPSVRGIVIVLALVAMIGVFALLLFVPAGRVDWAHAWVYMGIVLVYMAMNVLLLQRFNPELIERRMRFGEGTKRWDKVWAVLFAPVMYAIYIVAGLEARGGMMSLPISLWPIGFAIFAAGCAMLTWSMVVNPFFEKTVRIQTDRGHVVVDTGPYAIVRHPGYVGFVGFTIGTPLMLGSSWALIPAGLAIVGIVVRTALEDRTLKNELAGYPDYMSRVRYRLIPNFW